MKKQTVPQTAEQMNSQIVGHVDSQPNPPSIGAMLRRITDLEVWLEMCRTELLRLSEVVCEEDSEIIEKTLKYTQPNERKDSTTTAKS